jgi:hypothetical protein
VIAVSFIHQELVKKRKGSGDQHNIMSPELLNRSIFNENNTYLEYTIRSLTASCFQRMTRYVAASLVTDRQTHTPRTTTVPLAHALRVKITMHDNSKQDT